MEQQRGELRRLREMHGLGHYRAFLSGYFLPVGADAVLFSTCGLMCLRAVTSTTLPHLGHVVDVTAA